MKFLKRCWQSAILAFLLVTGPASAADPLQNATAIADLLFKVSSAEPLWNDFGVNSFRVILVSTHSKSAYRVNLNSEGARLVKIAFEALPASIQELTAGGFDFQTDAGVTLEYFNFDDSLAPLESFETIVHEAFHKVGQGRLEKLQKENNQDRRDLYPANFTPRLYRYFAYRAMMKNDLPAVKYWDQKYAVEFATERNSVQELERIEGSANYVGKKAVALALYGSAATPRQITDYIANKQYQEDYVDMTYTPQAGIEVYDLGGLAYALQIQNGMESPIRRAEKEAQSPISNLTEAVQSLPQLADADSVARFKEIEQKVNLKNGNVILPLYEAVRSPEMIKVVIPWSWQTGSMLVKGFLGLAAQPEETVYQELTWKGASPDGRSKINLIAKTVLETARSACGEYFSGGRNGTQHEKGFVVPISKANIREIGPGEISIQDPQVTGHGFFTEDYHKTGYLFLK